MLLSNTLAREAIKGETLKYFQQHKNWQHNLSIFVGCSESRRGKFTAMKTYIRKKKERPKINNLNSHLRKLQKEKQTKSKINRRKNVTAEINEI